MNARWVEDAAGALILLVCVFAIIVSLWRCAP